MADNNYRSVFRKIVSEHIHRKGMDELMAWLDSTDFYTAPASTKYHNAFKGGLCLHSINVFTRIMGKRDEDDNTETLAIVSLFHDLCKIGMYEIEMRNVKNEQGNWVKVPFYKCNETFPLGHGEKSLFLLQRYVSLSDEEALAVRWHMGGMGVMPGSTDAFALNGAMRMSRLVIKLQESDLEACYWDETE